MVNVVFNLVNMVSAPVVSFVVLWFGAEWCYHCHLLGVRSNQAPAPHPLWQKRQSTCLFLHRWLFLWVTKSLHKAQKLQSWSPIPTALGSLRAWGPFAVWPLLGTILHHHPPSQLFHGNQALTLTAGLDSSRVASSVERSVRLPFLHAISSSFHQPVSHLHCISIIFPAQLLPSVNQPLPSCYYSHEHLKIQNPLLLPVPTSHSGHSAISSTTTIAGAVIVTLATSAFQVIETIVMYWGQLKISPWVRWLFISTLYMWWHEGPSK